MSIRKSILIVLFLIAKNATALSTEQETAVPQVIVKPKKFYRTSSNGPRTFVTHQQIADAGAETLGQVLQNLGGVHLIDSTGNGSQTSVSMRGFGSNATSNTLLLINGIPITNPDLASPDFNLIPVNEIQYIEIIAGSESVLYGDQAVAGVINIITRERNVEKTVLSCNGGSYDQYHCYAAWYNHYKNLNYNVFAGNKHSNNYRDHNDYDQNQLIGGLEYLYTSGRWRFDYNIGNEDMQYPGALSRAQVFENRRQANNDTDFFKNWNAFFHLQNQQRLPYDWLLITDLVRRQMQGHGVLFSPFNQSRLTNYLKPQAIGKIKNVLIQTGIDLQDDGYHIGSVMGLNENTQQKYGAFALANIPIRENWTLGVGARGAEQVSRLDSAVDNHTINRAVATTVGLNYQPSRSSQFYLRQAGSFRFPKADENTFTANGIGTLRTQRGTAYEGGMQYRGMGQTAHVGLFQLNLRDEITFDPTQTPQQPFGTNRNLSPTTRQGLTLSGNQQITDKITVGGQYNYVRARFQNGINEGKRIPLVAENILLANLNIKMFENWQLYSEAIYTGSQYPANDDANIAGKMGGYMLVNFNLRYQYKNFSAALRLNNIFNKAYYFYTVFSPFSNQVSFYPAPEFNALLTIKYLFM